MSVSPKRKPGRPVRHERKVRSTFILHPRIADYVEHIGGMNRSAGAALVVGEYRARHGDREALLVEDPTEQSEKSQVMILIYPAVRDALKRIGGGNMTIGLVAAATEYRKMHGDKVSDVIRHLAPPAASSSERKSRDGAALLRQRR